MPHPFGVCEDKSFGCFVGGIQVNSRTLGAAGTYGGYNGCDEQLASVWRKRHRFDLGNQIREGKKGGRQ